MTFTAAIYYGGAKIHNFFDPLAIKGIYYKTFLPL